MERRDFLKGLLTAALATQLPAVEAEAAAETLSSNPSMYVNGQEPYAVHVSDVYGGWKRLTAHFRGVGGAGAVEFDRDGGPGIRLVSPDQAQDYDVVHLTLEHDPSNGGRTISMYFKAGDATYKPRKLSNAELDALTRLE